MSKTVEFFFDVGSPASYLAWTQLPEICQKTGATLVYRPMLLGGVFQATGNSSPATVPAKGRYTFIDLGRFAKSYGVELKTNPHFPILTLTLMRAAVGLQLKDPGAFDPYLSVIFKAIWVDAQDMNEPEVVKRVLAEGGFDPQKILFLTTDALVKAALKANTDEAIARGVFGAPTMFVGEHMFFGQDRLGLVQAALEES
jgi:2-hydroxychromene-2-carboxylate isomerase